MIELGVGCRVSARGCDQLLAWSEGENAVVVCSLADGELGSAGFVEVDDAFELSAEELRDILNIESDEEVFLIEDVGGKCKRTLVEMDEEVEMDEDSAAVKAVLAVRSLGEDARGYGYAEELWSLLSALRGPDTKTSGSKEKVTFVVRKATGVGPGSVTEGGEMPSKEELEAVVVACKKDNHFTRHGRAAAQVLLSAREGGLVGESDENWKDWDHLIREGG